MSSNAKDKIRFDYASAWTNLRDEVRRNLPIEVALERLTGARLTRVGQNQLEGCCPFHVERSPSFKVNQSRGTYKCFGSGCGAQGDIFQLAQDTQNVDFHGAIVFAADQCGVMVPDQLRKAVEQRNAPGVKAGSVARPIVRYPDASPKAAPAGMPNPDFVVVPDQIRRPKPGRDFRIWNNGGQDGDKDFEIRRYNAEMVHEYRDINSNLLMSILRVRGRDKKFFIPARLVAPNGPCPSFLMENFEQNGKRMAWACLGPEKGAKKPVYGMEFARAWAERGGRNILVVEGEKTCEAARRLLAKADPEGKWIVLTPMGGAKASIYADWAPLLETISDRQVSLVYWPDADKLLTRPDGSVEDRVENACIQVLSTICQAAIDTGHGTNVILGRIAPPQGVESGWDLADAEAENWTPESVIDWIKTHSTRVRPDRLILREAEPRVATPAPTTSTSELAAPY